MPKSGKRVLKNSIFQVLGAFGVTGLNFALMLGYAKILGPENFGSLVTSQAKVLIWGMLVDLGLSHSLIGALTAAESGRSELSRQGFRSRDLLYRVLGVRFLGAIIASLVIVLLARWQSASTEAFYQDIAFLPFLFATALQQTAISYSLYRSAQGMSVMANLAGIFLSVAVSLYFAFQGAPIFQILLAQSVGGLLTGILLFGYFFSQSRSRINSGTRRVKKTYGGLWGGSAWKALAQDAWPYAISFAVFVIWQRLDQIAASTMLGLEKGGQYALAVRLVSIPVLIATSISLAIFPDLQRVGRDSPEKLKFFLALAAKIIWRGGVLAAGLVLISLSLLLPPLLPKFIPALKILPFFVLGVWAFWMQSFLMNALFGLRAYWALTRIHLFALAVYIPILFLFTKWFELYGIVVAYTVFCWALCAVGFYEAKKLGVFSSANIFYRRFNQEELDFLKRIYSILPFKRSAE